MPEKLLRALFIFVVNYILNSSPHPIQFTENTLFIPLDTI